MKRYPLETPGGTQEFAFIYESDLYRLIIGSKLPAARQFESWVMDEVLPSIRKHGLYITDRVIEEIRTNPKALLAMLQAYVEEKERNEALAAENLQQAQQLLEARPKVSYYDMVLQSESLLTTTDQRQEHEAVQEELARVVEQMEELVALNARTAKHRAGFLTTYEELDARRVELEEREAVLAESITGTDHRRSIVLATFQELRKSGTPIEFSPRLWVSLIEDAVVSDAEITFRFKAGQEISIPI